MALTQCPDCGQEVSSEAETCPNCGRPWPGGDRSTPEPTRVARPDRGYNGNAVTAFVLGISSLLLCGVTGVIAIPFGVIALRELNAQVSRGEHKQKGEWMATTGIVIGALGLTLLALLVITYLS